MEEHLGYKPVIVTYEEMIAEFRRKAPKTKTKDLGTPEYFSLQYDSLLSELKEAVWITCNPEDVPILEKYFKLLEIC